MRIKQTARKSTARSEGDPMQTRIRVLETKRSSLGPGGSNFIRGSTSRGASTSRHSMPASTERGAATIGNNGKGKQIPEAFKAEVKHRPRVNKNSGVLREIRRLRLSHELLIPKAPFHRVVREITQSVVADGQLKYQMAAIMALQEAAEAYMVQLFEDAYLLTMHARRVTLFTKDLELCRRLRRE